MKLKCAGKIVDNCWGGYDRCGKDAVVLYKGYSLCQSCYDYLEDEDIDRLNRKRGAVTKPIIFV